MFAASKFSALGQVIKKTKRRACLCVFVPACACLHLFVVLTVSQLPLLNCVQIIGSISLDYPLDLLSPPPLPIVPPLYCINYLCYRSPFAYLPLPSQFLRKLSLDLLQLSRSVELSMCPRGDSELCWSLYLVWPGRITLA